MSPTSASWRRLEPLFFIAGQPVRDVLLGGNCGGIGVARACGMGYHFGMTTLTAEAEIAEDGRVTIAEPLPGWVRPGHARVLLVVDDDARGSVGQPRFKPEATPEMIARRKKALASVRRLNPYRDIADPAAWQREIRRDESLAD